MFIRAALLLQIVEILYYQTSSNFNAVSVYIFYSVQCLSVLPASKLGSKGGLFGLPGNAMPKTNGAACVMCVTCIGQYIKSI